MNAASRLGLIPAGLEAQAVWRWCRRTRRGVLCLPALLAAWGSADPAAWPRAVAQAERAIGETVT